MKLRFQVVLTTISKTTKHVSVFLLSIIMARMLPVETYGTYLQVQLVVNTLLYAAIFGIPHSIYYFLPKVKKRRAFLIRTAAIMFGLATVCAVGTWAAMPSISGWLNNDDLRNYALIIGLLLIFQIPIKIFEPAMITAKRVPVFVGVNFTFNVLFFFAVLIPLLLDYNLAQLFTVIVAFFAVQFFVIATAMIVVGRQLDDDDVGDDHPIGDQLRYSLPIGFSGMIGEIARQIDKIIISAFFNPYQFAVYSRGAMQIPLLNVISHSLHNILMPNFVAAVQKEDTPQLLRVWHSAIRLMAMFVYPTFAFFVATGDLFIPALFSDKYAEASIIFQIYMFTLLRRITSADSIIRAIGKTGILFKMSIFSMVVNIVITYFLVKNFGLVGAPLGTVITTYLVFAVYLRAVSGMLNLSIRDIIPWSSLLGFLGMAGFAIAIASTVRLLELDRLATLGGIAAVFSIIYWLLLRRSSILLEPEREALRGILPAKLKWAI